MPPDAGTTPLTPRAPGEVICHRASGPVTVGRFLAEAAALAGVLPVGEGAAVNACTDRYLALLGFAAALLRGHTTLLAAGGTPDGWRKAAAGHPGAYILTDSRVADDGLPVVRLDELAVGATARLTLEPSDLAGRSAPCSPSPSDEEFSHSHIGAGRQIRVATPPTPTLPREGGGSGKALPPRGGGLGGGGARSAGNQASDRHSGPDASTPPPIPPDRVVAIAFTSGSTGVPTAHAKSWGALVAAADAAAERFALRAADGPPASIVATVPPQHMYGFETTMMLPLRAAVAVHAGESFFPSDVLAALAAVPPRRVLVTTPLHLRALVTEGRRPPPLDAVISATAPLSRELAEAVERDWDAPMLEIYGATEAGSMASRRTVRDAAWTPYRGVALRPGAATVPGIGEVPLADVIETEADGRFRLLGRIADLVKLGGKRASLAELNRVLAGVEGVVDGVFVAPEDIERNPAARLAAYVVAPGRSAEQIMGALRGRMDPVFLPRRLALMEALPRNPVGKLTRDALGALGRDDA